MDFSGPSVTIYFLNANLIEGNEKTHDSRKNIAFNFISWKNEEIFI